MALPAFPCRALALGPVALLGACLHVPREPVPRAGPAPRGPSQELALEPAWEPGEVLLQGLIGAKFLNDFTVDRGSSSVELDEDEYEVLPLFGGGAQYKLAGEAIDFGLEGLLSFSGRADLEAFASSGGVAVAAFDVNLLVFEAYGGPFVSRFVGDRLRVYAGGGPLLMWAGYDQESDTVEEDADGSGGGFYARAGLEFKMPSGKLVGFGARWAEASVDLSQELGDLEIDGVELYFTYSYRSQPRRMGGVGW